MTALSPEVVARVEKLAALLPGRILSDAMRKAYRTPYLGLYDANALLASDLRALLAARRARALTGGG